LRHETAYWSWYSNARRLTDRDYAILDMRPARVLHELSSFAII